jgi:hypothetical protein
VDYDDRKQFFLIQHIVYCFNFLIGNQCLQHCNQILTLFSLTFFILLASIVAKNGRSAKVNDGIISSTKFLGII